MWDAERRVGVLNDFDLAKFTSQEGASGQENTGTLPYMALDLLSEKGLRGEIPRLYRHDAESFAWSLIYLCLSTVKNEEGEKYTMLSRRLGRWFADWETCRNAKLGVLVEVAPYTRHCVYIPECDGPRSVSLLALVHSALEAILGYNGKTRPLAHRTRVRTRRSADVT